MFFFLLSSATPAVTAIGPATSSAAAAGRFVSATATSTAWWAVGASSTSASVRTESTRTLFTRTRLRDSKRTTLVGLAVEFGNRFVAIGIRFHGYKAEPAGFPRHSIQNQFDLFDGPDLGKNVFEIVFSDVKREVCDV